jgi:hypothetical protein
MPKVKNVEKKIWDVEGFDIAFHQNGKDVHGAKEGIPQYKYQKAAKNDMTVSEWKKGRFAQCYPGYEVVVYDGDGNEAAGQTKLGTVRDSYQDEEG